VESITAQERIVKMKKILVIYYSQSGQLLRAVESTLRTVIENKRADVNYISLNPVRPFPFPWSYTQFFDTFPETVKGTPCELKPTGIDPENNYDLIVLAYQPWFLSVSIPMNSFLQSKEAEKLLRNKKVVTLIACRNMWLNAQEQMKHRLRDIGASLVGNITFVDRSSNLTSLISVLAFVLKGEQGRFLGIFPPFGVSKKELEHDAWKFGETVVQNLESGDLDNLQKELVQTGAVKIKPNLILMEGRGKKLFPLYADFILRKGQAGAGERRIRVKIFGIALPLLILILSPVITLVALLQPVVQRKKVWRAMEYYSGTRLTLPDSKQ
jgi:hypothetical protein